MSEIDIDQLALRLQPHYGRFNVANRLLFSGHSHQAWPDVALDGLAEGFMAAAADVDQKWAAAFERTEILRGYLRNFYDDPRGRYTLSQNTHDVLVRLMSAFDWSRPRIVTTDGEFHTVFRQTKRLEEMGVPVERVPVFPLEGIADRIRAALDAPATMVIVSRVFFMNSLVMQELPEVAKACREKGVPLVVDDYHGTNVAPISFRVADLEDVFWLIGGYKYLQWGEGNCFLRYPDGCGLRPAITGWFSSFGSLFADREKTGVLYDEGDSLFMGGTYDPVSQFRAAKVVGFFESMGITPALLRGTYTAQMRRLRMGFKALDLPSRLIRLQHDVDAGLTGGFMALESPQAGAICSRLREMGMMTDYRNNVLRLGGAPYLTTAQIDEALQCLKKAVLALE